MNIATIINTVIMSLICSCVSAYSIFNLKSGFKNGIIRSKFGLIDERTSPIHFKFVFAINVFVLFAALGVGAVTYVRLFRWLLLNE